MSNLSQHDAFYTGPLFDPDNTYVKQPEKGWAGGTSTINTNDILSSLDVKISDLIPEEKELKVLEFAFNELPITFSGTEVNSIKVQNFDPNYHIKFNELGIEPSKSVEINNENEFLKGDFVIKAVNPTAQGNTFIYKNAPDLNPTDISNSSEIVRILVIAKTFTQL